MKITTYRSITALMLIVTWFSWIPVTAAAQYKELYSIQTGSGMASEQQPSQFYKTRVDQKINVTLEGVPLQTAIETLANTVGLKLSYRGDVLPAKTVTLVAKQISFSDAMDEVLSGTKLDYVFSRDGYMIITKGTNGVERLQAVKVTGRVVDDLTGEPLPGASIVVQGTTIGVTTDAQGRFELTVPNETDILVVSYVGYFRLEVPLNGATNLEIKLKQRLLGGSDIVVTALGIDRDARALGYAVASVNNDDMTVNRSPNFVNTLQGKMAGVNITNLGGTGPQGSSKIRIRGQSSFGANNSPLIVVNGVPIDNTNFGVSGDNVDRGTSRNSDSGDGLSSINPDDIESLTVLKGAAAAALYGARAKDGVIMITTKNRAKGTGIQIDYNTNFTFESPMDFRDYQFEYGQGEGGKRPTSAYPTSGVWSFGEKFAPGMTHILYNNLEVPYEPQRNQLLEYYQNGRNLTNSISVSSGSENGGFSLSLSNLQSVSILPGSNYDRNTVNVGFTQSYNKKLTFSGNINYSKEDRQNPPNISEQDYSPVVIYTLATSMPMSVLKANAFDALGNEVVWSRFSNRTNPYFALSRFENNMRDRVFGNVTIKYDLADGIFVQGRIGQDYYFRDQDYNLPTGSQRQTSAPAGFVNGQYVQDKLSTRELNADVLISANKTFGAYGVFLNAGGNQMYRSSRRNNTLVQDFYARGLYSISNGRSISTIYNKVERRVNSLYGSAEVNYNQIVYLTGTLRNDWFSTLSEMNRSILYPSVATSFIVNEVVKLPSWMTYTKLRASYAEVGSDTDVPPYSDNLYYTINPFLLQNKPIGSVSGNVLPNPNLRPMRVEEIEFGLDLKLFDNVVVELSYYDKTSRDQILNQQISNGSGYTSRRINIGASNNKGVEALVSGTPLQKGNLRWSSSFNVSYNQSEVLDLGTDIGVTNITVGFHEFHGELRQVVGKPMNQLYGWGWLRDSEGRQIFNATNGLPVRAPQMLSFGSSVPKWVGGFTNGVDYKDMNVSFLIDFKLGHKLISGTHTNAYRHGLDKATLIGRDKGCVVGEGVTTTGAPNTICVPVQQYYEAIRTFQTAEQSVFNAGSWQLRQITFTYDLTDMIGSKLGLKGVKLSAVANNVAVLKKWVPHIHPDQNGIISDARAGLESTGLPVTRGFGFNLNVKI
jgi:TonB-linked SusC/RagA family outer membrane protein